jgi:hypothetical protein
MPKLRSEKQVGRAFEWKEGIKLYPQNLKLFFIDYGWF